MPRRKGGRVNVPVPVYDSDDERAYEKESVPDPTSNEYFYDEVDEFHQERDKLLLDKGIKDEDSDELETSEEEVLGLESDDDDDDDDEFLARDEIKQYKKQLKKLSREKKREDMGSDIEDEERGLPDSKAWGSKRFKYYGADVGEDIDLSGSEDEQGTAALEEKEALALQKKMAQELEEDEDPFGLKEFQTSKKMTELEEEIIKTDVSTLSDKEKLQLLKKESPELLPLIDDFKVKLSEVQNIWLMLLKLVEDGRIQGEAANYVETKYQLCLNYCTQISFYMALKCKRMAVHSHPVIKRILQFRNLLKQLEPLDQKLKPEIDEIMKRLKNGEEVNFLSDKELVQPKPFKRRTFSPTQKKKEEKKMSELMSEDDKDSEGQQTVMDQPEKSKKSMYETTDEKAALAYYQMLKGGRKRDNDEEIEESADADVEAVADADAVEKMEEEGEYYQDGKRAITYQIQKNKGLTPRRKKELRNPRVKHRMKFRKAKIRRKGQIRETRKEIYRYGGEISGIRAGIMRGIKLK